ncbi:MAG: ABC transporter ATP-binding protein [Acidimicrobiia bacterium]
MSALAIDGLTVEFMVGRGRAPLRAVDGLSLTVAAGEQVALVGESGSGKSLTALAVMGLIDPPGRIAAGSVVVNGRELVGVGERELTAVRGRDVAMVFQDSMTALNPTMRIGAQIAEAVEVHDGSVSRADAQARATELLQLVHLDGGAARLRDYPHQLSGGMRQRVMLAIALANRPKVLLADEPTTALDATTQGQLLELLDGLRAELGLAVLFITHDLAVVAGHADRVAVMYAGRIVEEESAAALFASPRHPYTRGLIASSPRWAAARGALTPIDGQPPSLGSIPAGCAFHTRCAYAEPRCAAAVPELRAIEGGGAVACVRVDELPVSS